MTLVPTDEIKDMLKKYEELWNRIRDLTSAVTNISSKYGENVMKIIFNSDDDLPLKQTELHNMVIVVRSVFHESIKYCPHIF